MGIVGYLVSLVLVGLVIGGLGRLVVPGENPIGIGATILYGLVGAVGGATAGALLGLGLVSVVLEVGIAALLVYLGSARKQRALPPGSR